MIGLEQRLVIMGLHWSAGHPGHRLVFMLAALARLGALGSFWTAQGQFRGW